MERDMGTTLATKTDLLLIRQEIENQFALLSRDIENLRLTMTVRLGSMIVVAVGVILAAFRLWS
jgi:hypothetical protein